MSEFPDTESNLLGNRDFFTVHRYPKFIVYKSGLHIRSPPQSRCLHFHCATLWTLGSPHFSRR